MENENKPQDNNGTDLVSAALKFAQRSSLGRVAMFFVVILLAMQVAGLSLGTLTEKWFGLKQTEIEQTYELQKLTFEFIQKDVMAKLENIEKTLENHEGRITALENKVGNIETENKQFHKK